MKKVIVINILNFINFKRNSFFNIAHMKFEKSLKETYVNMGYKIEDEIATENFFKTYLIFLLLFFYIFPLQRSNAIKNYKKVLIKK